MARPQKKQKELFSKDKLNEFGKDYVKLLIIFIKQADKIATSAMLNSVNYKIREDAREVRIILEANDYLDYVDAGRKPGKYPPISAISKWASVKGIPQSAVFPIAKKIHDFGIAPTNLYDKVIREIETSRTLNEKLDTEIVKNLEEIIVKELIKTNERK